MIMAPLFHHVTSARCAQRLVMFALLAACITLAACGFRMKGATPLPFDTLYTNIAENSPFGAAMRRAIRAASPNTRFTSDPSKAQAHLIQLANDQGLRQLSIDAEGHVEEYELNLVFSFQLLDSAGRELLPITTLRATRDVPYDDTMVQAKQSEIDVVFQQMQQSMVDRVVRHITAPAVSEAYAAAQDMPPAEVTPDLTPLPDTTRQGQPQNRVTPYTNPLSGFQ
jgi:Rare lipoprotein B